jgi:hypothetical protein
MKINANDIKEILPQLPKEKIYTNYVYSELKKEVEKIKQEILKEFNEHPVTQEIESGIDAQNISQTLNGVTNLYSFIGFEAGTKPVEPVRELLNKIALRYTAATNGDLKYIIDFPTAQDIFKITPMPWATGRSWAQGIEIGISGLGYYIRQKKNSRSGLGVQSDTIIRAGLRFNNTKYISHLIKNYINKIENLTKNTIL